VLVLPKRIVSIESDRGQRSRIGHFLSLAQSFRFDARRPNAFSRIGKNTIHRAGILC
jgi:hypothetical protein